MADKRIDELEEALSIAANDLFVLQQANTAKKLSGQTMTNFLLALANGHGGISSIDKTSSSATDPVVDTYTVTFADQTTMTFEVTNGAKGDTGARGPQGPKGDDATITSTSVMYQAWPSGTQYPTGTWVDDPPAVTPGNYLWTRTIVDYSDGEQTVSYSVARWGIDGSGAVASVNGNLPDQNGNVTLTAEDVGAIPDSYQPPVTSVNNKTGTVVLDNKDVNAPFGFEVSATLSTAGWYRVCKTANLSGSILKFYLATVNVAETHEVDFMVSGSATNFANEVSVCTHLYIDKIRSTYNGNDLYVDVHYNNASGNIVKVGVTAYGKASDNNVTTPSNLVGVNDAPSGETVVTTYNLTAKVPDAGTSYEKREDGTLIQWGVVTNTANGYRTVQFDVPFIDDTYVVTASARYSSSYTSLSHRCIPQKSGLTGVTINFKQLASTASYTGTDALGDWIAIGRWK